MNTNAPTPVPSPCISLCRIDPATGWCQGCARSLDDITAWAGLPPQRKREVWAQLPQRRQRMGAQYLGPQPHPDEP